MEVILIFSQPADSEWSSLKASIQNSSPRIVVAPGIVYPKDLAVEKLPLQLTNEAAGDLLRALLDFGDRHFDNKLVSERLSFGNLRLWHYMRFRMFFNLKREYLIHAAVEYYKKSYDKITLWIDKKPLYLPEYCQMVLLNPKVKKQGYNLYAWAKYLLYFTIKIVEFILINPHPEKRKHAIVDRSLKQWCRDAESLELKKDNYTLSNLLDKANDDFLIIAEAEQPKFKGRTDFMLSGRLLNTANRRHKTVNGEGVFFKGWLSPKIHKKRKIWTDKLTEELNLMENAQLLPIEKLFLAELKGLKPGIRFFMLKYLSFEQFFTKYPMHTVTAIDENSPATRCILDAAAATGSKRIGIQHGNIGNAQPAYLYTPKDRRMGVMADKTLVWGEYWKNFLIEKGNFPPESIHITGQIRTDVIPAMKLQVESLRQHYSIKTKVALFASQPIPDAVQRRQAALDVFTTFAQLPDVELFVKLHPAEYNDENYYRELSLQAGIGKFRLFTNDDLYSLLCVSDLVITCYSTVGTEAIYFNKPLIILDPRREDLLGYHAAGVAAQAIDASTLLQLCGQVLNDTWVIDEKAYSRFVGNYAYRIDGQATERTLQAIYAAKDGILH